MNFSRRDFSKMILGAAALGLIESSTVAKVLGQTKRSMLWLSMQNASGEGRWTNLKIEGKLPKELNGTLFRATPGQMDNFGTQLNHLFDGDAYLSSWRFREGKVELHGRFVPTPSRLKELEAKKMLFNEFGSFAPDRNNSGKNQPSVNVVEWNGKLLGLSEFGLPTIINPDTFDFEGYESFNGAIPDYIAFTAHPRFDPITGDMFAWGVEKRPSGNIHVYHIERKTNKANLLYKIPLNGIFMTHDSMLTENYFLLMVPPIQYDIMSWVSRNKTLSDTLKFVESQPTRLFALPRNNQNENAKPIQIELPPEIVFHYGNAYEIDKDKIVFEMVSTQDKILLETLGQWRRNQTHDTNFNHLPQTLKQVTVDLSKRSASSRVELAKSVELPRYDLRLTGQKARFLYATERVNAENAAIVRVDLQKKTSIKAHAGKTRTFGEPVFVQRTSVVNEERGWIFAQGYDGDKNESFLEIRDAQTLEFESRIWAGGQCLPLGFHGNFYQSI